MPCSRVYPLPREPTSRVHPGPGWTRDLGITWALEFGKCGGVYHVAGFWEVFYIDNSRFALDTLRVANRSPTPASKINDFLGLFGDI